MVPSWLLPLPPGINASYRTGQGRFYKSDEATAWARGAALIVGGWTPPPQTPLAVSIRLEVPQLYKRDIDSSLKALLDCVVGPNRDQWIVKLDVVKVKGDGWAHVTVSEVTT